MLFMFSTRARLSELLDVKIKDLILNREYPYVVLSGKGNKTRIVPMTKELENNLKYYIKLYHSNPNNNDYLFYSIINNQKFKMSPDNIQRIVRKYGKIVQSIDNTIIDVHPHILRHSFRCFNV